MECSCNIDAGVDEPCEVLAAEWITACRRYHRCGECDKRIAPPEAYYQEVLRDDDGVVAYKTCEDCKSLRDNMMRDFFIQQVRETIADHIWDCAGQMPEECLAKLTPNAREWVCHKIEAAWAWWDAEMPE